MLRRDAWQAQGAPVGCRGSNPGGPLARQMLRPHSFIGGARRPRLASRAFRRPTEGPSSPVRSLSGSRGASSLLPGGAGPPAPPSGPPPSGRPLGSPRPPIPRVPALPPPGSGFLGRRRSWAGGGAGGRGQQQRDREPGAQARTPSAGRNPNSGESVGGGTVCRAHGSFWFSFEETLPAMLCEGLGLGQPLQGKGRACCPGTLTPRSRRFSHPRISLGFPANCQIAKQNAVCPLGTDRGCLLDDRNLGRITRRTKRWFWIPREK